MKKTQGSFEVLKYPSRVQFANMGTKPESGLALLRNSSLRMGHVHIQDLQEEHYNELCKPAPISCYKYYQRDNNTK